MCVGSLIHVRILYTKFIDQTHRSNWLNVTYWNFNEPITNSNLYRNFICIPLLDVVIPGVHTIQAVKLLSRLGHIWRHWFHLRNEILCLSIHHLKRYAYIMCSTVYNTHTVLCVCAHFMEFNLNCHGCRVSGQLITNFVPFFICEITIEAKPPVKVQSLCTRSIYPPSPLYSPLFHSLLFIDNTAIIVY